MSRLQALRVKLFADGADLDGMLQMAANPLIRGFTTNPTLMRKAGVEDYEAFARRVLAAIPDRPVSLEVFADDFGEMMRQARVIATWGPNVNVKIPVTNTAREFSGPVIRQLSHEGIALNVTAILTVDQVPNIVEHTERAGTFRASHPRRIQAAEQRLERRGRTSQGVYRQIEIEVHRGANVAAVMSA